MAGGHAPAILEMRECAFDDVAPSVGVLIKWMEPLARGVLVDDRCGSAVRQELAEGIVVVGGVTQRGYRGGQGSNESWGGTNVTSMAARQFEGDDASVPIGNGMDFCGSPTSASPNGLHLGPPFRPASQRRALAVVVSMR